MKIGWLLSVWVGIAVLGCTRPIPALDGFDASRWKSDIKGCQGLRIPMIDAIRTQRDKLKGLSEVDLATLLGNPDRNDLAPRNEKFYYYYLQPSPQCAGGHDDALQLIVRFNATGVSREVAIE